MNFDEGLLRAAIPPRMHRADARVDVVDWLARLPVDCVIRAHAAIAWERTYGAKFTAYELHAIINGLTPVEHAAS